MPAVDSGSPEVGIPHVAALDGLRGAAVAAVLLFHGGHLRGGYLGVDLFFVLSGFLITSLLLAEYGRSGAVRLGRFWSRRARRLLPALGALLAGVALYCVLFARSDELGTIRADALATIGYVANWRSIFAGTDYFALFRQPSPLGHVWSLAIEEQFYLIWPLVFVGLLAWRRAKARFAVLVTAVGLALVSSVLMVVLYDPLQPSRSYFGTDTRAAAILMGAALAAAISIWGHVKPGAARIALEVAGIAGALTLGVLWARLPGDAPRLYRGGFLVAGLAAVAVLGAAVHPQRGPISRLFSFRPLCLLGLISYGLYLWHWPVDIVFLNHSDLTGWTRFAVETAVALVITIASYRFLEMPIRRGAIRASRWNVIGPTIAFALVGFLLISTAGATTPPPADLVRSRAPGGVLVLGDSVAASIVPGLLRAGQEVSASTKAGCRFIPGSLRFVGPGFKGCPWPEIFRVAIKRSTPRTALVMMGVFEMFDVRPDGTARFLAPGTQAWARIYRSELERASNLLLARGVRVVMPTIPCMGSIPSTADRMARGPAQVRRVRAANRVIESIAKRHPNRVLVPDLFHFLCPSGRYQRSLPGVAVVRVDGEHFTRQGSDLVARWLGPSLDSTVATSPRP